MVVSPEMTEETNGFEIFPWNRNFETGIEMIDEQHKVLVEILNRLARHCGESGPELDSGRVLDELVSYAAYHFRAEEVVWNEALGEAEMARNHHDAHQMFFEKIQTLRTSGAREEQVLTDLLAYLTRWLAFHILESDRRMALTVKAVESGVPVHKARDVADEELSGIVSILVTALLELYDKLSASTIHLVRERMARQRAEEALRSLQVKE